MNNSPLVSIIMPTYNHGHYIGQAIESVLAQTYKKFELIIIDNHSTDNTSQVISNFTDERISHYLFQNNGSIAASRNFGIRQSKGHAIAFLDSDDYWFPEKIEKCLSALDKESASFCVHSERLFQEGFKSKKMIPPKASWINFENLLFIGNKISTSSVLLKKELLDLEFLFEEDKKYITAEDYDLWLRIAKKAPRFCSIQDELGGHRLHTSNMSSKVLLHHNAVHEVLKKHFNELKGDSTQRKEKIRIAYLNYCTGRNAYKQQDYKTSVSFLIKSIKGNPLILKSWVALLLSISKLI